MRVALFVSGVLERHTFLVVWSIIRAVLWGEKYAAPKEGPCVRSRRHAYNIVAAVVDKEEACQAVA